MDLNEVFQKLLDGQEEIKQRLDRIEARLNRMEQNQADEVKILHRKVRRVEKVFNEEVLANAESLG